MRSAALLALAGLGLLPGWLFSPEPIVALQRAGGAAAVPLFRAFSVLGEGWALIAVLAAVLWRRGLVRAYAALFAAVLAASAWAPIAFALGQPRPHDPRIATLEPLHMPSFPSGHIAMVAAVWGVLAHYRHVPRAVAVVAVVLASVGRVGLGMHYPADVAAGALLGALVARAFAPVWRARLEPLASRAWVSRVMAWAPLVFVPIAVGLARSGGSPKLWELAGVMAAGGVSLALVHQLDARGVAPEVPLALTPGVVAIGLGPLAAAWVATLALGEGRPSLAFALAAGATAWALLVTTTWQRRKGDGVRKFGN